MPHHIPLLNLPLIPTITTTLLALTLTASYRDYQSYISLGPGGTPHNLLGWFAVRFVLRPFTNDMLSTDVYTKRITAGEEASFLETDLPDRERPAMGWHVAPQRQVGEFPEEDVKDALIREFLSFAERNPHLVQLKPSNLERHEDAFFLADGRAEMEATRGMRGEIAHVHRYKDASVHVVLTPADCKKVIESGWGQRHPLSGATVPGALTGGNPFKLPSEYVFVYAPRNEGEVAVAMGIIGASVKYMTGSEELR